MSTTQDSTASEEHFPLVVGDWYRTATGRTYKIVRMNGKIDRFHPNDTTSPSFGEVEVVYTDEVDKGGNLVRPFMSVKLQDFMDGVSEHIGECDECGKNHSMVPRDDRP